MSSSRPSTSSTISAKVPTESDPTLDITSDQFDPLKALYAPKVVLPVRDAKIYDNIGKYESVVIAKRLPDGKKQSSKLLTTANAGKSGSNVTSQISGASVVPKGENPFQRKFLPHQSKKKVIFFYYINK